MRLPDAERERERNARREEKRRSITREEDVAGSLERKEGREERERKSRGWGTGRALEKAVKVKDRQRNARRVSEE